VTCEADGERLALEDGAARIPLRPEGGPRRVVAVLGRRRP
jgi:hypothetical protein